MEAFHTTSIIDSHSNISYFYILNNALMKSQWWVISLPECSTCIPWSKETLDGGCKVSEPQVINLMDGSEPEIGWYQWLGDPHAWEKPSKVKMLVVLLQVIVLSKVKEIPKIQVNPKGIWPRLFVKFDPQQVQEQYSYCRSSNYYFWLERDIEQVKTHWSHVSVCCLEMCNLVQAYW